MTTCQAHRIFPQPELLSELTKEKILKKKRPTLGMKRHTTGNITQNILQCFFRQIRAVPLLIEGTANTALTHKVAAAG